MARDESVVCEAIYPDGRSNLQVRVRVNKRQLETARRSHGKAAEIERMQRGIAIQVKQAMREELGKAPRWIDWDKLQLVEQADLPAASEPKKSTSSQPTLPLHMFGWLQ